MILVAGGTGRLGAVVVRRLVARGLSVRVLTRDPARICFDVVDPSTGIDGSVPYVVGDVRRPDTLTEACAGITTVVSAVHGFAGPGKVTPASVDRDGNANLVRAAESVGAQMVLMSGVGVRADHPMELFRMKAAAEDNLRTSGASWTIVRATAFAELYVELMQQSAKKFRRPLVFGRGDNPISFVAVDDVAAAVELAVTDTSLRGKVLEIGGPDNLTLNQLAAIAVPSAGSARHIPRSVLRMIAATGRVSHSQLARQAAAAVVMDSIDMTFDAVPGRRAYPELPFTSVSGMSSTSI